MGRIGSALLGAGSLLLLLGIGGGAVAISGIYNVAADVPHWGPVSAVVRMVRQTSIAVHARGVIPPNDLDSPDRIAEGGALYGEMCAQCHLGPGVEESEIATGLYPPPPGLARASTMNPAEQFWVIKHGVKFTAMAAWGKTHSDALIWDMVAFLQQLPRLSEAQYRKMTQEKEAEHDHLMREMDMH